MHCGFSQKMTWRKVAEPSAAYWKKAGAHTRSPDSFFSVALCFSHPIPGPEASSDTQSWDYKRLRQHCPFFGLIYAMEGEEEEYVEVGP